MDGWQWGIAPKFDKPIAWGCRAIFEPPERQVDVVHDRMQMLGGTEDQRDAFWRWICAVGLPRLRRLVVEKVLLHRESRCVSAQVDGLCIVADPRASHGYLYVGMYPVDDGACAMPDFERLLALRGIGLCECRDLRPVALIGSGMTFGSVGCVRCFGIRLLEPALSIRDVPQDMRRMFLEEWQGRVAAAVKELALGGLAAPLSMYRTDGTEEAPRG